MPPETPDSSSPSELTVTFTPRELLEDASLPTPTRAANHYETVSTEMPDGTHRLFTEFADAQAEARDAVTLGWMVLTPHTLTVSVTDSTDPELQAPPSVTFTEGTSSVTPIEQVPAGYRVDTGWNVTVPTGMKLVALPPLNHARTPIEVIPSTVVPAREGADTSGQGPVPVEIPVRAHRDGRVSRGTAFVQLVLLEDPDPVPSYRSMTAEEETRIEKRERELGIYPSSYAEQRTEGRSQ